MDNDVIIIKGAPEAGNLAFLMAREVYVPFK